MTDKVEERVERVIQSSNPFRDDRGSIENYDLVFPVNMANIISSKKGTVRANHYHPEQLQQVLVISGSYVSVSRDLSMPEAPLRTIVVKAGELSVMPPMVAHAMVFLEDCTFLNLVAGNRDHDKFGRHTIPYTLVPANEAHNYMEKAGSSKA